MITALAILAGLILTAWVVYIGKMILDNGREAAEKNRRIYEDEFRKRK